MEGYISTCLFPISIFLDIEDMRNIARTDKRLLAEMVDIINDQNFWRHKVENILNIKVPTNMYKMDWYLVHVTLSPTYDPISLLYSDNINFVKLGVFTGAWCNEALIRSCEHGYLDIIDIILRDDAINACIPDDIIVRCCCLLFSKKIIGKLIHPKRPTSQIICMDKLFHIIAKLLRDPKIDIDTYNDLVFSNSFHDTILSILDRITLSQIIDSSNEVFLFLCASRALYIINKINEYKRIHFRDANGRDILRKACIGGKMRALILSMSYKIKTYNDDFDDVLKDVFLYGLSNDNRYLSPGPKVRATLTKEELSTCMSCI